MREFKFRAWDKEEKRMISGDSQELVFVPTKPSWGIAKHYQRKDSDFDESTFDWASSWLLCERYLPMQYVGLKDKNDKEIYEGDIVIPYHPDIHEKATHKYTVKYIESTFFAYSKSNIGTGCQMFPIDKYVEVIGNIYENPELLER